jgi:hypothetical protein
VPARLRLVERVGRLIGFSPEGRSVRVWVKSRPGEEDAEIVGGTLLEVTERGALVDLNEPVGGISRVQAVPRERGWGLDALWFAFIAVDAYPADGEQPEPLGQWWIRLAR